MSVITALTPHPRRQGRVDVLVDGKSVGAISGDAVARLRLSVGTEFEPVRLAFEAEAAALATWDAASRLLAARARSRSELRRQLLRKGEPVVRVDQVLDRLERAGYLDDADYARQFARSRSLVRGMSRRRVQQELAKRGIAREVAEAAIADVFAQEGVDEYAAVERLARRKLPSLAKLDPIMRRRRLYAFLARRGFESDDIQRVIGALGIERFGDSAEE
ncbi:MAG: regulatory protein RecX [Gemmatimonadaceae bacterium]|nr:regulatory protein RecX [Gemmatimonadaceae bacterium]